MQKTRKVYTFIDEQGKVICEVIAENHDQAISVASHYWVEFTTDFYSTEYTEIE